MIAEGRIAIKQGSDIEKITHKRVCFDDRTGVDADCIIYASVCKGVDLPLRGY